MKEIILVAGQDRFDVAWIRCCLESQGYGSILCKTLEALLDKLRALPVYDQCVSLVVIEPEMLTNATDDLIVELREWAQDITFVKLNSSNIVAILMSVDDWISESVQDLSAVGTTSKGQLVRVTM